MSISREENALDAMDALLEDARFTEMWQVRDFVRAVVLDELDCNEAIVRVFGESRAQRRRAETAEERVEVLEAALKSADEWMSCVDDHLRDGQAFKLDRAMIRAALQPATDT